MRQLAKLSLATYWQNKAYASLVIVTLIIACAGLTAVQLINNTAKQSYADASQPMLKGVHWRIASQNPNLAIQKQDYVQLRTAGFNQAIPLLRSTQVLGVKNSERRFRVELVGIDSFALLSLPKSLAGSEAETNTTSGSIPPLWQAPYTSLIHKRFAEELSVTGVDLLLIENGTPLPTLSVVEYSGLSREIVMDITALQDVLGVSTLSEILLVGELTQSQQGRVKQLLPAHLALQKLNVGQVNQLTESFHLNLLAMGLLMFVVCIFVVMNALNLLFAKRMGNYRICRQLGVTRASIYRAMSLELFILSLICAPFGTFAGYALANVLSPEVQKTLYYLYDVRIGFNQPGVISTLLQSLVVCLLGTLAASSLPAWQLKQRLHLKKPPVTEYTAYWLAAVGVLLMLGLTIGLLRTDLPSSFALIACLLLAGAGLMIVLQPKSLKLLIPLARSISATSHWAVANSIQLSNQCKIAFATFFIAVASNIGMNIMVDSFRQATEQWVETRLIAPHYLYTQNDVELANWLEQSPVNWPLVPRYNLQGQTQRLNHGQTNEQNVQIYSYPTTKNYQQAMELEQQQVEAWQRFASAKGWLVNQQLAARLQLKVGDNLSIDVQGLSQITLPVVGVYYDYGNPKAQALLPLEPFTFPKAAATFALHSQDAGLIERLRLSLEKANIKAQIQAVDDILNSAMRAFDRTFVITDSLNWITLLVAAISLATSILLIGMENAAQPALLRCLGLSRGRLFSIRLGQFLLLGLVTSMLAMPFGLGLSYILVDLVNWRAFQWSYPVMIDIQSCLQVVAMTLLVVLLSAFLPLCRIYWCFDGIKHLKDSGTYV